MTQFIAWFLVWSFGLLIFDGVLALKGPWLMLGGAITWVACVFVNGLIQEGEA